MVLHNARKNCETSNSWVPLSQSVTALVDVEERKSQKGGILYDSKSNRVRQDVGNETE